MVILAYFSHLFKYGIFQLDMAKTHKPNWRSVLLIPAVFMIVVSGAFIWGVYRLTIVDPSVFLEQPVSTAPSVEDYRASAVKVMEPFFVQISVYDEPGEEITTDRLSSELVLRVQSEMIAMIVPVSEREAHLSFVLLLDQWERVWSVSSLDSKRATLSAQQAIDKYPWIQGAQ